MHFVDSQYPNFRYSVLAFQIFVIMMAKIHADADDVAYGDTDDVINDGDITTADDDAGNFDGAFAF